MRLFFSVLCGLALVPTSAFASELDSPTAPSKLVVKKLDPTTKVVTSYRVDGLDAGVHPDNLRNLTEAERNERVASFLRSVVKPENKIGEEKVTLVRSELDGSGSTSAWWGRWYGGYSGYYGYPYYSYYNNYSYYYRPYWGYSNYGYYNSYYSGYYNYGYGYYPYYSLYGCGW